MHDGRQRLLLLRYRWIHSDPPCKKSEPLNTSNVSSDLRLSPEKTNRAFLLPLGGLKTFYCVYRRTRWKCGRPLEGEAEKSHFKCPADLSVEDVWAESITPGNSSSTFSSFFIYNFTFSPSAPALFLSIPSSPSASTWGGDILTTSLCQTSNPRHDLISPLPPSVPPYWSLLTSYYIKSR